MARPRTRNVKVDEGKSAEVKCAFCRGTGVDRFPILSPLSKCPVCTGRGVVHVREPFEKCAKCEGAGLYMGSHLYCWTCRGKGVVPKKLVLMK